MPRVVVAGSINMDVVATACRHPKIGETVAGDAVNYFPGGKGANQAVAAARLGALTSLIGCLGDDAFGTDLRAFLAGGHIDLTHIREVLNTPSGAAVITVAKADNTIVVVPGANAAVSADDVKAVALSPGDIAVSQFEIPCDVVTTFLAHARAAGATTILNPAPAQPFGRELLDLVDILVLNETELALLTNIDIGRGDDVARVFNAAASLESRGAVVTTLGARGVAALIGGERIALTGHSVAAVDTTGAGDCFVGALAARLCAGAPLVDALAFANAAAAISVQRIGAAPSMPALQEVEAALRR